METVTDETAYTTWTAIGEWHMPKSISQERKWDEEFYSVEMRRSENQWHILQ